MKKPAAVLLSAIILIFILCACSQMQLGKSNKPYTIDLIVKGTSEEFWKRVNDGAQAAADIYNMQVNMYGPDIEENYQEQIEDLQQSVLRRPDAVVLAAADYYLLSNPVAEAVEAKIPVVMVDSDVDNSDTVAYIGTDNAKMGQMLAETLCADVSKGGTVGVVSFVQESYPAVQRELGFRTQMSTENRFTLLDTVYCDSDINRAYELTHNLIQSQPDMAAMAAFNAQAAEGAARALSEAKSTIPLYVIDCMPQEAMYMEEGIIRVALLQNPYQMGYYSVEAAYCFLSGQTVKPVETDIYMVTQDVLFDDLYQQLIFPFE